MKGNWHMRVGIGIIFGVLFLLLSGLNVQAGVYTDGAGTSVYDPGEFTDPIDDYYNWQQVTTIDEQTTKYAFQSKDYGGDWDDVYDLDHGYYYTWYIPWSVPDGEHIISAELQFDGIYNHRYEDHDLWVNLLDDVTGHNDGEVKAHLDSQNGANDFNTNYLDNFDLVHYDETSKFTNADGDTISFPTSYYDQKDISYTFTKAEFDKLAEYANDNNYFGLGLDPDCHYYNNGVYLLVTTSKTPPPPGNATPEPGSAILLGLGMLSFTGWQRRRQSRLK